MSASRRIDTSRIAKHRTALRKVVSTLACLFVISAGFMDEVKAEEIPQAASLFDAFKNLDLSLFSGAVFPNEIVQTGGFDKSTLASALFDLVQYMRNNTDTLTPDQILAGQAPYRRVAMFGTWVNENAPQNCYNTRAEVLLRDFSGVSKITFSSGNPCQVLKGSWHDPYSGTDYELASAVQIDHVVPLKNAYRSGAYGWTRERRCHYGNYLQDNHHLLAVSGHENMVKSDSGPENYLPPDEAYVCKYISNWMRIKASWGLRFSGEETLAIEKELRDRNCPVDGTRPALADIQQNRASSVRMNGKCVDSVQR